MEIIGKKEQGKWKKIQLKRYGNSQENVVMKAKEGKCFMREGIPTGTNAIERLSQINIKNQLS